MSDVTNLESGSTPSKVAYQDSKNGSIHSNSAPVATGGEGGNAEIHDRTGLLVAIVAIGVAFLALGYALNLPNIHRAEMDAVKASNEALAVRVQVAEREARLAQKDAMLLKATVIAHGIPVNEDQLRKDDK